jgi:hypothetical protein
MTYWRSQTLNKQGNQVAYLEKTTDLSQVTDKTLSHNVVHLTLIEIQTYNIRGDRH